MTRNTLGEIFADSYELMREVRADLYGIRTFLRVDERPVKFESISEGRISLKGATVSPFPVEVPDRTSCIAEKLLAHAVRGQDESTHARDLVDLAFMAGSWPDEPVRAAMGLAESAYGAVVGHDLAARLSRFDDEAHRRSCLEALSISDTLVLERGLLALRRLLAGRGRSAPGVSTSAAGGHGNLRTFVRPSPPATPSPVQSKRSVASAGTGRPPHRSPR